MDNKKLKKIREQFSILKNSERGKSLIYFDNGATTQKPKAVIDSITDFYNKYNANIHRGSHFLARHSTKMWLDAHKTVASFLNADSYEEIIFVRNCTEALNMFVQTYGRQTLTKEDTVVITEMEHHSNIVPWQILQKEIGFDLEWIPLKDDYTLDLEYFNKILQEKKVKIVSIVHVSNVLGVTSPVKEIVDMAHSKGAFVMLDSAQSVAHMKVDVKDLDVDGLSFSGHKVYAPTGSGALYIKKEYLEKINPIFGGGEMIKTVSKENFELNDLPWRFEAGTPNIQGGIALSEALKWLQNTVEDLGGWSVVQEHEKRLAEIFLDEFDTLDWFHHFGPNDIQKKSGIVAFNIEGFVFRGCKDKSKKGAEGDTILEFLDKNGICMRDGYHCAEPLHDRFCFGPTLRASFAIYNTEEEVKKVCQKIKESVLRSM